MKILDGLRYRLGKALLPEADELTLEWPLMFVMCHKIAHRVETHETCLVNEDFEEQEPETSFASIPLCLKDLRFLVISNAGSGIPVFAAHSALWIMCFEDPINGCGDWEHTLYAALYSGGEPQMALLSEDDDPESIHAVTERLLDELHLHETLEDVE